MAIELLQNVLAGQGSPGEGWGGFTDRLIEHDGDMGIFRPWRGQDGRSYYMRAKRDGRGRPVMTQNKHGEFCQAREIAVCNVATTMTRDAWIAFDAKVNRAMRDRLKLVSNLRGRGLTYTLPNGMAHTVLHNHTVTDLSPATVSMSPVRRSEMDRPLINEQFLPLYIIHKDFSIDARELMVSKNGSLPQDTTSAESAAFKVAEEIEKMGTGTTTLPAYGGGNVYGITNHPDRASFATLTTPTGSNGPTVLNDILAARQLAKNNKHHGPFMFYANTQWEQFLDNDFSTAKGDLTLRQRIMQVGDIVGVEILDYLPNTKFRSALVEMTEQTARVVIGMEPQTITWETDGGMRKHYKVMALIVVQFRADTAGESGIVDISTA